MDCHPTTRQETNEVTNHFRYMSRKNHSQVVCKLATHFHAKFVIPCGFQNPAAFYNTFLVHPVFVIQVTIIGYDIGLNDLFCTLRVFNSNVISRFLLNIVSGQPHDVYLHRFSQKTVEKSVRVIGPKSFCEFAWWIHFKPDVVTHNHSKRE